VVALEVEPNVIEGCSTGDDEVPGDAEPEGEPSGLATASAGGGEGELV
jgi:hypothetical protein